jgi:hypothetical protein
MSSSTPFPLKPVSKAMRFRGDEVKASVKGEGFPMFITRFESPRKYDVRVRVMGGLDGVKEDAELGRPDGLEVDSRFAFSIPQFVEPKSDLAVACLAAVGEEKAVHLRGSFIDVPRFKSVEVVTADMDLIVHGFDFVGGSWD